MTQAQRRAVRQDELARYRNPEIEALLRARYLARPQGAK